MNISKIILHELDNERWIAAVREALDNTGLLSGRPTALCSSRSSVEELLAQDGSPQLLITSCFGQDPAAAADWLLQLKARNLCLRVAAIGAAPDSAHHAAYDYVVNLSASGPAPDSAVTVLKRFVAEHDS